MRIPLKFLARLAVVLCFAAMLAPATKAASDDLLVFAASSLTEAITEVGDAYARAGHPKPVFSFAASSALARQIESDAPANLFISADEQWMDELAARKMIVPESRTSFLGNTLVLIAPADRPFTIRIEKDFPLAKMLGNGKLSMGDPDSVPVGKYGKAALENLDVWSAVQPNVIRGDNVRVALAFVERGEASAGIVYATDAALSKRVTIVGTFPQTSYPPVSYPLAVVAGHDTAPARAFREFLLSDAAKAIFSRYGFSSK